MSANFVGTKNVHAGAAGFNDAFVNIHFVQLFAKGTHHIQYEKFAGIAQPVLWGCLFIFLTENIAAYNEYFAVVIVGGLHLRIQPNGFAFICRDNDTFFLCKSNDRHK